MSLISPKNFIAPLTNVVNLATIVVIALLFGVYRLSGGGVSITSRKNPPQSVKQTSEIKSPKSSDKLLPLKALEKPAEKEKPANIPDEDNSFDELLENQNNEVEAEDSLEEQPVQRRKSSLDDIAKQLGVE